MLSSRLACEGSIVALGVSERGAGVEPARNILAVSRHSEEDIGYDFQQAYMVLSPSRLFTRLVLQATFLKHHFYYHDVAATNFATLAFAGESSTLPT